jgi:DNA modification methylase
MSESFLDERVILHCGDCLEILQTFPENSIDSVCCDPPYHLQSIHKRFAKVGRDDKTWTSSGPHQRTANGFMNQKWDGGDIAFRPETWAAVYRVLKPGAFLLAFSGTRTYHRMACAIEDAGSEPCRFWYSSKADSNDRIGSKHPTVKPVDLMQYLCRLVTPQRAPFWICLRGRGQQVKRLGARASRPS